MTARIPHRELRNSSGKILRAVADGENFIVTNRGQEMALITQIPSDQSEARRLRLRPATRALNMDVDTLVESSMPTSEMLEGLRDD